MLQLFVLLYVVLLLPIQIRRILQQVIFILKMHLLIDVITLTLHMLMHILCLLLLSLVHTTIPLSLPLCHLFFGFCCCHLNFCKFLSFFATAKNTVAIVLLNLLVVTVLFPICTTFFSLHVLNLSCCHCWAMHLSPGRTSKAFQQEKSKRTTKQSLLISSSLAPYAWTSKRYPTATCSFSLHHFDRRSLLFGTHHTWTVTYAIQLLTLPFLAVLHKSTCSQQVKERTTRTIKQRQHQ